MKEIKRAKNRLKKRIQKLLCKGYKAQFLTLTFKDEILNKTNETTRKRYIKEFLKKESALYIANKDYGSNNKREHYHAFIIASTLSNEQIKDKTLLKYKNQINFKAYKYGNIKARFIATYYRPKNDKDYKETALYIANHFYKETTKNSAIITSRNIPTEAEQIERLKRLKKAQNQTASSMDFLTDEAEIIQESKDLNNYLKTENSETLPNEEINEIIETLLFGKKKGLFH